MNNKVLKTLKFLISWPLTIISLYYVFALIAPKLNDVIKNVKDVNYSLLITGVLSFIIFYFIRSVVWHLLINDNKYKISFKETAHLWAISELKRYIPGNIWSLLGRTALFSEKGISKLDIAKLLIIEAEIFIVSCAIVSLLSIPFVFHLFLPFFSLTPILILLIYLIIFIFTALFILNRQFLPLVPKNLQKSFCILLPDNSFVILLKIITVSTLGIFFFSLGSYFSAQAIIFTNPQYFLELIGFFAACFLLGFLSFFTPSGLGVREGLITVGLAGIMPVSSAAFCSLFTRVVLVIAEIIFVVITFFWKKIKNAKFINIEKLIVSHWQELIVILLIAIYVIYFSITSFLRYDNFYTGRFDLGNMAQTVWNTLHGRIFVFTNPNGTDTISRLAFHADFILILLAPFYYFWQNPKMLLLIQSLTSGAGAVFVYLIARNILKNKNISLVLSFAYLLNPGIERANLYDFHPVTMATFFLLGTFYYYQKKNYFLFILFALLAALTKEEIWVIIGIFGLFIYFFQKKKLLGASIFLVSISIFYYLIAILIPQSLGSQHFALSYYSEFGDSPFKIIRNIIIYPYKTIGTILEIDRLNYLRQLFSPIGYLSFASPLYLIFSAPDLLINLLSNNAQLHQIYYQYTSPINPFIFISAIMGIKYLKEKFKLSNTFFIIYLLTFTLLSSYFFGPLPGAKESNLDMFTKPVLERNYIEKYLNTIPKKYSVSATNNVGSHLSERQKIYTIPLGLQKADIIVFLLTDPEAQPSLKSEWAMAETLKTNKKYLLIIEKNNFLVFKKKTI